MSQFDETLKTLNAASDLLQKSLNGISAGMDEVLRNAPEADKPEVQRVGNMVKQALKKAADGDSEGINELIKTFNNGRTNNQ